MWSNFHTHSTYCDGKASLAELLDEAESMGLASLGFSSHAPLPFQRAWAMKQEDLESYFEEVAEMKRRARTVEVYTGLEIDYVRGLISPRDFSSRLDYTIGSVHFVDAYPDGTPWEIDNTNVIFMDGLEAIFGGDVKAAIARYFELTREMVLSHTPNVVGHLDKIKIQNTGKKLFDENDSWYRDEMLRTVKAIRQSGAMVEINTRGIYQRKSETTYPGPWVVKLLFEHGIPVTICSDAHHPKDLTSEFATAARIALEAGYKTIQVLHEGKWKSFEFNENGLVR